MSDNTLPIIHTPDTPRVIDWRVFPGPGGGCVCVGGRVLPRKAAEIGMRRQRKKGGCRGDKVGDWVSDNGERSDGAVMVVAVLVVVVVVVIVNST